MSKSSKQSHGRTSSSAGRNHEVTGAHESWMASRGTRETIESIVVAVILAFLFRGFEAEAFVIPTGSMANTLKGRHIDLDCPQCGQRYQMGSSTERDNRDPGVVVASTCPVCRYTTKLDYFGNSNERSFTGDRILVNKFAYDLNSPKRWDVIVFKYPGNAKQNYIKRLIGLPNEVLRIRHGDIYFKKKEDLAAENQRFKIAHKPPHKVKAMLQLVDDSRHIAQKLRDVNWPSRWQPLVGTSAALRSCKDDSQGFSLDATKGKESWLRYHHFVPTREHWDAILNGQPQAGLTDPPAQLISDFYAYNVPYTDPVYVNNADGDPFILSYKRGIIEIKRIQKMESQNRDKAYDNIIAPLGPFGNTLGVHWVGDLALECEVEVSGSQGQFMLDLVEGGVRFECRIELSDGKATLSIHDQQGRAKFAAQGGQESDQRVSVGPACKGPGRYRLRLANIDNQLYLWVNERVIDFHGATNYDPGDDVKPVIRSADRQNGPSDLAPAGVGASDAKLEISRLRILRDIYYIATRDIRTDDDYNYLPDRDSDEPDRYVAIEGIFRDPLSWVSDPQRRVVFDKLFDSRRKVHLPDEDDPNRPLGPNSFLPMGDNSPFSKDARMWSDPYNNNFPPPFVHRNLLIGKAVFVYWPHQWRPFWPSFDRMGYIR